MGIHESVANWHWEDGVSFFKRMCLPKNAVFYDLGCGYGEYVVALALSDPSSIVYAIDNNKKMLKAVEEKIKQYNINNVRLLEADFTKNIGDVSADLVLMYDVLHGNDLKTKLPLRFKYLEAAKRMLKINGVLSVAPFECAKLKDRNGKYKKYSIDKLTTEIEEIGFKFKESIDGAIHFGDYHSDYHWKKHNGDMPFSYLEQAPVLNFISC